MEKSPLEQKWLQIKAKNSYYSTSCGFEFDFDDGILEEKEILLFVDEYAYVYGYCPETKKHYIVKVDYPKVDSLSNKDIDYAAYYMGLGELSREDMADEDSILVYGVIDEIIDSE